MKTAEEQQQDILAAALGVPVADIVAVARRRRWDREGDRAARAQKRATEAEYAAGVYYGA
jgi:antitoxin (DNA-binding transcriptional repressor) of toxin-antitoxin stability system